MVAQIHGCVTHGYGGVTVFYSSSEKESEIATKPSSDSWEWYRSLLSSVERHRPRIMEIWAQVAALLKGGQSLNISGHDFFPMMRELQGNDQ